MDLLESSLNKNLIGSTRSVQSGKIAPVNSKNNLPTGNFTRLEALMMVEASHMATDEKLRKTVAARLS